MRIQHNIMAMNAYRNYNTNTKALAGNLEKLSSGYKINRAGDDAAGLAISEKMRAQITGLDAAQKNVKDGISLVKTAEGAMQEIQDMLNRMDYLATQSANGTYQDEVDRENLQKEVDALKSEINRIADSANFNGIKLLDGSLSSESKATSIDIGNVVSTKSAGWKASYESVNTNTGYPTLILDNTVGLWETGDKFSYTVALSDGKSYSADFTFNEEKNGTFSLIAADGTKYDLTDMQDEDTALAALDKAVVGELNKTDLGKMFSIGTNPDTDTYGYGAYTFDALEEGTAGPTIDAFDARWQHSGETYTNEDGKNVIGVYIKEALDAGREIKADDIIEYNGTNYDEAVFTINGKKFVLMTDDFTANPAGNANDHDYMRAVEALGPDVTVLVGGRGGLKSGGTTPPAAGTAPDATFQDAANSNFKQNIAKIAEVTGLNVTDAVNEDRDKNVNLTGAAKGEGIRLSIGTNTTDKSLTLQIGDTADSYNQMKVSVGDMHTEALGINGIDISNQSGAQAAIQTIKDAINQVSSVRGDLGAIQNRLEHTGNNLSVMAENIQDAESTIRDTDVADEMMKYVKNNILVQSAQAMLAQANQVPQGVLQLLG